VGRLTLVTGGARSGKSAFAEKTLRADGRRVVYIATAIWYDGEMRERVARHRERRPQNWVTLELPYGISRPGAREALDTACGALSGGGAILLDCLTVLVSNIMLETVTDWEAAEPGQIAEAEQRAAAEAGGLLTFFKESPWDAMAVANEVGMGLVPPYPVGRAFRDIAGRVNQLAAETSDEVYLCVAGIPVKIK
jgi:adenosylcobinamide kinase/adenosylcobinamide-phosphate guanylyltransferase